jgi:hypothetical protein
MAYIKTTWVNTTSPAINAGNLNKLEQGVEDAHIGFASAQTTANVAQSAAASAQSAASAAAANAASAVATANAASALATTVNNEVTTARGAFLSLNARQVAQDAATAAAQADADDAQARAGLLEGRATGLENRADSIESWKAIVGTQRWMPYFDGSFHGILETPVDTAALETLLVEIDFTHAGLGVLRIMQDGITGDADDRLTFSRSASLTNPTLAVPQGGKVSTTVNGANTTGSYPLGTDPDRVHSLVASYAGTRYKIGSIARQYLASALSTRWVGYILKHKITVGGTVVYDFRMNTRGLTSEPSVGNANNILWSGIANGDWQEKSISKSLKIIPPRVEGYVFIPRNVYIRRMSATQYFIYQICTDGKWTRYEIRRDTELVTRKVDVFRLWQAQVGEILPESPMDTDVLLNAQIVIQTGSQNEYAIKPAGSFSGVPGSGFMGGQHGWEQLAPSTAFGLFLDGRPVTLTDGQCVAGDRFEFVQNTELDAPTGSTGLTAGSKVADVRSRLIWDERGYSVDADFMFVQGFNITAAYGCMAAVNRADTVSTKARYHGSVTVFDVSSGVANFTDAGGSFYGAEISNDTNEISVSVEVGPQWIDDFATSKTFIDRETVYTKIYPSKIHTLQRAVVNGTRWKLPGTYKIDSGI